MGLLLGWIPSLTGQKCKSWNKKQGKVESQNVWLRPSAHKHNCDFVLIWFCFFKFFMVGDLFIDSLKKFGVNFQVFLERAHLFLF